MYLLKDQHGKVIYVGKAKNLRTRVRTYFRGGDERSQVRFLMQRVVDLETLVTSNDKEALILENNLIKQYKPRYNIALKDDKSYVSVKVTTQDAWPRLLVTRRIVKDGSKYYGPYTSAYSVRETLDTIRKVIPLRTCSDAVFRNRSRPCLEYQIKRCLAPCCLPVEPELYQQHLREAIMLLEGAQIELGADKVQHRHPGIVVVQVFVPANWGDKTALDLADSVAALFRRQRVSYTDGSVVFRSPSVRTIGVDGAYFQVNVSIPFVRDHLV